MGSKGQQHQHLQQQQQHDALGLVGEPQAQLQPPQSSHDGDDGLCTICCDRKATCVFLECGHGGYCWRCAHVLYVRPPNECPVCRARIELVLEVADPHVPLGGSAAVVMAAPQQGRARVRRLLGLLPCAGSQVQPVGHGGPLLAW